MEPMGNVKQQKLWQYDSTFFTNSPAVLQQQQNQSKIEKKITGTPEHLVYNKNFRTLQNTPDQISHPDRNGHFFKRSVNNFLTYWQKSPCVYLLFYINNDCYYQNWVQRKGLVFYMRVLCELANLISLSGGVYTTIERNAVLNVGKQEGKVKMRDAQADWLREILKSLKPEVLTPFVFHRGYSSPWLPLPLVRTVFKLLWFCIKNTQTLQNTNQFNQ